MVVLSNFDGGLSTRVDPTLIQLNSAQVFTNVDPNSVVLKSAKNYSISTEVVNNYLTNFNNSWISSNNNRDYVSYSNKLYFTDTVDGPKKYNGTVYKNLGLAKPEATLAVDADNNPIYDQEGKQFNGITTKIEAIDGFQLSVNFASNTNGNLTNNVFYNYKFVKIVNNEGVREEHRVFNLVSGNSIDLNFDGLENNIVRVYRLFGGAYKYLTEVDTSQVQNFSDTVENIAANNSYVEITADLFEVTFNNLSGGYLQETVEYNYRIAVIDGTNNIYSVDKSYTLPEGFSGIAISIAQANNLKVRVYREYNSTYRQIAEVSLNSSVAITDVVLDISNNTEYTNVVTNAGVVQYTMTYYNEIDDVESPPMTFSSETTVTIGDKVLISNLPIVVDPQTTHRRIYRLGGNLTQMTLVKELEDGTTSFYDYTSDIDATKILDSTNNYPPEASMHSLIEEHGIFFGLVGDELRFSKIGRPDYWPPENSINIGSTGTGLLATPEGILIFSKHKTQILLGSDSTTFRRSTIDSNQGCLTNKSCQEIKSYPVWVSKDGICTISNGLVEVISKSNLGKINLDIVASAVYDEQYFLVKSDGNLLVLDMRHGVRFYELNFAQNVTGIAENDGNLYFVVNGYLATAEAGSQLELSYTSPVLIENNHSNYKSYNNIYVRANGNFTFKVYIDYELALTKSLSGNKIHDISPPVTNQRGSSCYFEIVGTGTVYSIDTTSLGRQNGR